jgi:hypothetical protein
MHIAASKSLRRKQSNVSTNSQPGPTPPLVISTRALWSQPIVAPLSSFRLRQIPGRFTHAQLSRVRCETPRPHKPSSTPSGYLIMPITTTLLCAVSLAFGTIPIGFAMNWYFSTAAGVSFFYQIPPVKGSEHAALVDCMATVIGVRNLVLGVAIVSAALVNEKRTLGVLFLSFAVLAIVDGIATYTSVGQGGSDHIGYAPVVAAIGVANLWTAGTK